MNEYFANNPMVEMFKKSLEDPMHLWSAENWQKHLETLQDSNMLKNFNPGAWMSMQNKMIENNPWINFNQVASKFNLADNIKKVEMFADMHKLSLENAQAVLRRQAEIIQKHANDLYKLMQNMVSSPNPEAAMSLQADYVKATFDSLAADFKELLEMYSKAHLDNFEHTSNKVSEHLHNMSKATCAGNECHSEQEDNNQQKGKKNHKN